MKYKALLWDIDGTILNFKAAEAVAIRTGFKRFNLGECTDEMIKVYSDINVKWWAKLECGECTKPETLIGRFHEFFELYNLDSTKAEEFNRNYQVDLGDTIEFCDDAPNIIKSIVLPQFGVTNGTKVAQSKKIKTSGLDNLLEAIFISDEIGYEKPYKEYFDVVLSYIDSKYGYIPRNEIAIIGDSLTSDIQGGNNMGFATIWYNAEHKENKGNLRVDYEIDNLKDLLEIIK